MSHGLPQIIKYLKTVKSLLGPLKNCSLDSKANLSGLHKIPFTLFILPINYVNSTRESLSKLNPKENEDFTTFIN